MRMRGSFAFVLFCVPRMKFVTVGTRCAVSVKVGGDFSGHSTLCPYGIVAIIFCRYIDF